MQHSFKCRFCSQTVSQSLINLGMLPRANLYLNYEELNKAETFYPLHVYICEKCFLVQLEDFEVPQQVVCEYAYFSPYSDSWIKQAENYTEMIMSRLNLGRNARVVEIASNEGYLLQFFKKKGICILGIEPVKNIARAAAKREIPTLVEFFGSKLAEELAEAGKKADLLIANNVLSHVPNLNDFVIGLKTILKPDGAITMEFPHLLKLMIYNQYDTIYHEHLSYFSFSIVQRILENHGLMVFDVEELKNHGGSLRIYVTHIDASNHKVNPNVGDLLEKERKAGLNEVETYISFSENVRQSKRNLLSFLIGIKNKGKRIAGYGAPVMSNTLLNYCGIGIDFIDYTVDKSPYKQGLYLPGSHIPVFSPERLKVTKPDYVMVLPWSLKDEIIDQISFIRDWGGKFIVPIPGIEVL